MPAECRPPVMQFARLNGRDVVADFGGGVMTSDAGALLLDGPQSVVLDEAANRVPAQKAILLWCLEGG